MTEFKVWLKRTLHAMTYGFLHPIWLFRGESLPNEEVQHRPYLWQDLRSLLSPDPLPKEDPPSSQRERPRFRDIFRPDTLPMEEDPNRGKGPIGPLVDLFRADTLLLEEDPHRGKALRFLGGLFVPEKLPQEDDL